MSRNLWLFHILRLGKMLWTCSKVLRVFIGFLWAILPSVYLDPVSFIYQQAMRARIFCHYFYYLLLLIEYVRQKKLYTLTVLGVSIYSNLNCMGASSIKPKSLRNIGITLQYRPILYFYPTLSPSWIDLNMFWRSVETYPKKSCILTTLSKICS